MQHSIQMPTTKTILSTAASVAATAMVARSLTRDYLPPEVQSYISRKFKLLLASFSNEITITIDEFNGLVGNQLFGAAELYLGSEVSPLTQRFRATMPVKQTKIIFSMDENQQVVDVFNGVKFVWRRVSKQVDSKSFRYSGNFDRIAMSEVKFFQVRFHKKHRDMVFSTYLPHILSESMTIREEKKTLKLHTLNQNRMMRPGYGAWQSVNFNHPATFETLAMDLEIKKVIKEDLDRFVKRKEFYRKVGKAWKRGYLLFGPPGTGKSSLIAAMANYLNFDVYDLELTDIRRNSELRKLVMTTANRSILVVEDIDCSIDLQNRAKKAKMARTGGSLHFHEENEVTLSGLLNFIDGLWSSCGDERIIVFTTNHKDRLDPAILRPGRMDVHIHMSYCTQCGFRMLTRNYLGITEHTLFSEIDSLMEIAKVTPAEVGEQLMKNEDPEITLKGLLEFLKKKNKRGDLNSHQKATEDEEKANLEDTRSEQHKTEESEEIICTE